MKQMILSMKADDLDFTLKLLGSRFFSGIELSKMEQEDYEMALKYVEKRQKEIRQ